MPMSFAEHGSENGDQKHSQVFLFPKTPGFGPAKAVTVTASPPSLAEITVELTGGAELNDGSSTVNFGTKQLNQSEVRSLTVTNDGTEDLTRTVVKGAVDASFAASVCRQVTVSYREDSWNSWAIRR